MKTIEVTEADIKDGARKNICGCPIALAIKRAIGDDTDIMVKPFTFQVGYKMKAFKIAVDFDGTIAIRNGSKIKGRVPGAMEWIGKLQDAGAKVYLNTARTGARLTQAMNWLPLNGLGLEYIPAHNDYNDCSAVCKPAAHVIIDDRALCCPIINPDDGGKPYVDWTWVGPMVMKMLVQHNNKQIAKRDKRDVH